LLWFVACLATLDYNGPFFDEGIYLTAGQRTLEGHGHSDGYLGWFAGSLLWPMVAGMSYEIGGLTGARAAALSLAGLAFLAFARAVENLFGRRPAFWATLALALSGPFTALARMGVYDSTALAGLAVSLFAITELAKRDHRAWLVVAAVSFAAGMLAKYPSGLMLLPLLGTLGVLRRRKTATDVVIFGFVSLAVALAFFLPVRGQLSSFFHYRLTNTPASGVRPAMIAVDLLTLSIAPMTLAVGGWFVAKGKRGLASVLLLSLAMWPAYHLILKDPVSSTKHIVFGFLFAYPLVGLALSALWRESGRSNVFRRGMALVLVVGLGLLDLAQLERFNHAWPDVRPAARHLVAQVEPGQKLLINESWPFTMYLYGEGRIGSPWDVFDVYRLTHGESEQELCGYDWFVDSQGSYTWPESVSKEIQRCGGFRPVFSTTSTVVAMGWDLSYVRYPVRITVWQNVLKDG
jgi:hypothetical protein